MQQPVESRASPSWICFDVGGQIFKTTKATIQLDEDSGLPAVLFKLVMGLIPTAKSETGAIIIDRDPTYFRVVLNFLRYGKLVVDEGVSLEGVHEEAQFFQLKSLINILDKHPPADFTRRQVVSRRGAGRFRSARLCGLDLSNLYLREEDFTRCNISYSSFEGSDLSDAKVFMGLGTRAVFRKATLNRAILTSGSYRYCNFSKAELVGMLASGADFSYCDFTGADLSNSILQNAVLVGCQLRSANLSNVKFQRAFLMGADLSDAQNLDTAHFKDSDMRDCNVNFEIVGRSKYQQIKITLATYESFPPRLKVKEDGNWVVSNPDELAESIGRRAASPGPVRSLSPAKSNDGAPV